MTSPRPRPAPAPAAPSDAAPAGRANVAVECGWGRLIFGQTFRDPADLVDTLLQEQPGRRDVAFYVAEPHVVLALAPTELFLDPSHAFRLALADLDEGPPPHGVRVRGIRGPADIGEINRICLARRMVQIDPASAWPAAGDSLLTYLVAEDAGTGAILGAATGVDHVAAFDDPENAASLWSLAVDPQSPHPGVGEGLVRALAAHFRARGRAFMDLSVMHDNTQAIALYDKLGFTRLPTFTIKTKNSFNEKLYIGPSPEAALNPYARILTDEARRRGITVEVVDEPTSLFRLSHGGRSFVCRESLTSATSAAAMTICDDKALTRRLLAGADLRVPDQATVTDDEAARAFLDRYGAVVVKPARGEQGRGIAVNLTTPEEVTAAVAEARRVCDTVLLEEFVEGEDLRVIVIDFKVVAAAIRRPAQVAGDGRHTVRELIERQSRRRAAATGGESRIPLDDETARCVTRAGRSLDDVLPAGETLLVRRTANLHTGGTIHDVTDAVHPDIVAACVKAARVIDIPVVGLDLMVPDVRGPAHWFIEANERPGLANHEPQPTAERFIDMLFPQTIAAARIRRH
ncbi:N-acetylglutaminylglutamine synthetase [Methylobacterium isbiliense]|uniref:Glutathione biosynthesis bifunctional protein GshAB n=1 Tax=Methylobacterium isbiliense TaxID=315478 RepID=A0ABQ4SJP3_9HYPH|nr:N-acetylglutaminylglutamine synthetase [Methylobacterium isbiliense]MDN3624029.1 N-acetylglutaminylglutamine synthetase [Methylobacterium isbiliense]GJE03434.1 Glutathione biosynthesis bifunctional protein GshAB [Methylobacterium isbiliense]